MLFCLVWAAAASPPKCCGRHRQQEGFPALIVLDSTDPEAILGVEKTVDLDKTVFIVASKSGTTLETLSMQRYFFAKYGAKAGDHFIAITDPGSKLEGWAKTSISATYF